MKKDTTAKARATCERKVCNRYTYLVELNIGGTTKKVCPPCAVKIKELARQATEAKENPFSWLFSMTQDFIDTVRNKGVYSELIDGVVLWYPWKNFDLTKKEESNDFEEDDYVV